MRKVTTRFVMYGRSSPRPRGTARLSLDGLSWNLISEYVSKYVEEIEVLLKYDKNNGYLTWRPFYIYYHISLSSSENEKSSDILCRENHNIYFMFNNFNQTSCRLWYNVERYCRAGQTTGDYIARAHYVLDTYGNTRTRMHARAHARALSLSLSLSPSLSLSECVTFIVNKQT